MSVRESSSAEWVREKRGGTQEGGKGYTALSFVLVYIYLAKAHHHNQQQFNGCSWPHAQARPSS